MFERIASKAEQKGGIESLEKFIEKTAEKYREENIPVGADGRIDMRGYKDLYPNIENDMAGVREYKKDWPEIQKDRLKTDGEQLEMLAYAIFSKHLGDRFIVARSAPFDDRTHSVDTILLDRETGNLVCAFDEVGDTMSSEYQAKQEVVQKRNFQGGAKLKYGLALKVGNGEKRIVPSSVENIPLFYIALNQDRIKKGVYEFNPEGESEFEKKLFDYFIAAITLQISALELYSKRLNPNLNERLVAFKDIVNNLNSKDRKN